MLDRYTHIPNEDMSFQDVYPRMFPGRGAPKNVTFIVTERCNLQCSYCYEHYKTNRDMSIEVAKQCVDLLFKQDEENSEYINPDNAPALVLEFIGGEPLVNIELIAQIVDYFLEVAIKKNHRWKNHYMISMTTNGTLYFRPEVQRFLRRHRGRISMAVTIDGNKELHDSCRKYPNGDGSYEEAAKAQHDLSKRYGLNGTKLTIAPANLKYLYTAVVSMIKEFAPPTLHANCVYEEGWTTQHAQLYYEELKKIADWVIENEMYRCCRFTLFDSTRYLPSPPEDNQNWCGGNGKMLAFDINGDIYPCTRYAPISMGREQEPFIIGHCDRGIEVLPGECEICERLRNITRRSQSTDECFNCPIAKGCSWCTAYNYQVFGTPDKRATFTCCMHRAASLANVYYWNKLARKLQSEERFVMYLPKDKALEIISEDEYNMLYDLSQSDT